MTYKEAHEYYGRFCIPVADGDLFGIDYVVKNDTKSAIIKVEPDVYVNYVTDWELQAEPPEYIYVKIFLSPMDTKLGKALYKK